jgi:hypothetical protein
MGHPRNDQIVDLVVEGLIYGVAEDVETILCAKREEMRARFADTLEEDWDKLFWIAVNRVSEKHGNLLVKEGIRNGKKT